MARIRDKKSKIPFSGLNLKPEEDQIFIKLLEDKGLTCKQLLRALVRQWIKEGGSGVLTYVSPPKIYKH